MAPELNSVVTLANRISPWLMVLQAAPDRWTMPEFTPGQYTTLGLFGNSARCDLAEPEPVPADPHKLVRRGYCIASSPAIREFLEFYIHLVPAGVLTPPTTTGAVKVESTSAWEAVVSWVFHKGFIWPTVLGERAVSPRFQPVRSRS